MAIRNPGRAGESPGAEAGHERAEAGNQPRNAISTPEVLGRTAVEARHVESD